MRKVADLHSLTGNSRPVATSGLLQRACACGGRSHGAGECALCKTRREGALQRAASGPAQGIAPPVVHEVLSSQGQPLDRQTRAAMEPRFGHDFSQVRVHTGSRAAESARAVNALAYTVGNHVAFDAGQYAPGTREGQRLLAHELTHVVQQGRQSASSDIAIGPPGDRLEREADSAADQALSASPAHPYGLSPAAGTLQRKGDKVSRIDVALLFGDDDSDSLAEARSYASTVIHATSGEDAKAKLAALGSPIGTLFIVSHSNAAGEIQVVGEIGTIRWVKASELGSEMKDALPPDQAPRTVDFRGCKMGDSPDEMDSFREHAGADTAKGSTCWTMGVVRGPLVIDGAPITSEDQLPEDRKALFAQGLRSLINELKSDDGKPVKNCIVGLGRAETADKNITKIRRLYFRGGGTLVATWASPEFNHIWQPGSICTKAMTSSTRPCKIVTVNNPASKEKHGVLFLRRPNNGLAAPAPEGPQEDTYA